MANASYAVPGFHGGEISQFAQGSFEKPEYKISLNVCLNSFPVEIGPWVPRPGTAFAGATRGGKPGRVIKWDFEEALPYTQEYTDGFVRFRQGAKWATTNDTQAVIGISTANPAVVHVASAWATGATTFFSNLGTACPLLQNRQFSITHVDSTHFSLQDALTGTNIDGSTLGVGSLPATATVSRIQELATPYTAGTWAALRGVQAERDAFLLHGQFAPQQLSVTTLPSGMTNAVFALSQVSFLDGPYLDAPTSGVQVTPNQKTGVIQLALSFPAYVATTSYAKGDFVTSSSVNYESLIDQNVGNTPASSPSDWVAVSAGAAINNGQGFLSTDIGRLVRLFSEPAAWAVGTTYAAGAVVSYNPTGIPGEAVYWQSLVSSNTGNVPGTDLTHWEIVAPGAALPAIAGVNNPAGASGPAQWTYGKIVSLVNFIAGNVSGVAQIGTLTGNGGLSASFNGITVQVAASSSALTGAAMSAATAYIGQNYSGTSATAYAISSATVFPSSDDGLFFASTFSAQFGATINLTAYLYGSNSPPSSYNNGTLLGTNNLGTFSVNSSPLGPNASQVAPFSIASSDTVTTYAYVWVAFSMTVTGGFNSISFTWLSAQIEFVNASGTGSSSNGVNVELLGPSLLYTNPIITWQLGAYSNTTGWPSCGCYSDGRLWLGGAIANRFDACTSNGISGDEVNFAPTNQYGTVADSNAISYTLNSDGVNPIFWMQPDQQGIILGTQANPWLLFPPGNGGLSPLNIDSRPIPGPGASNVLLRRTEHTYIYVQRYGVKLMEYFPDIFSGKFTAPNLADKAQHITRAGIAEVAYTYGATPIIWGRCNDGSLFGCTYKRDTLMTSQGPTYYAWHRHTLGSGRVVTSVDAGPSVDGTLDALTMVTNQATSADPQFGVNHVEILTNTMDELTPAAQAWFLDDAVVPSSTVSTSTPSGGAPYGGLTLNGLWHLNGESVAVYAGGLDCGNFTVASGSIFVPYGDSVSAGTGGGLFTAAFAASGIQIVVGFTYNSDGQLVRSIDPRDNGARNGPALGKERRNHKVAFLFNNLAMGNISGQSALSFGTDFSKLKPALINLDTTKKVQWTANTTYSGVWRDSLGDEEGFDGMVCWRVSRPMSCNVVAIEPFLDTKDQ